jgi:hypothetical protein
MVMGYGITPIVGYYGIAIMGCLLYDDKKMG